MTLQQSKSTSAVSNIPRVTAKAAGMHLHRYRELYVQTDAGYQLLSTVPAPSDEFEVRCQDYSIKHGVVVIAAGLGGNVNYYPTYRFKPATMKQRQLLRKFEATLPNVMSADEASRRINYWLDAQRENNRRARHARRNRYHITGAH